MGRTIVGGQLASNYNRLLGWRQQYNAVIVGYLQFLRDTRIWGGGRGVRPSNTDSDRPCCVSVWHHVLNEGVRVGGNYEAFINLGRALQPHHGERDLRLSERISKRCEIPSL